MSSYLWVGGTIQPDRSRQSHRGRALALLVCLLALCVLGAAIVHARTGDSGVSRTGITASRT